MLKLVHTLHERLDLYWDSRLLFSYIYVPTEPPMESPRPFFYPVNTLAGDNITIYRPHDHRWHHGISMTMAVLSGENFWGGPTYVRDQGYVQLDNNGRQQHEGWKDIVAQPDRVCLTESLTWISHTEEAWLDEERSIEIAEVKPDAGFWSLDLAFRLRNVSGRPLSFGSPTTEGRVKAGYGGLFWRGPRDFSGGKIMIADGPEATGSEDTVMGEAGRWLAYVGQHDGVDGASTLVFVDSPGNPRHPNKWFVRAGAYGCVSTAFTFDETYTLPAGDQLSLAYRLVFANGEWSRDQIEGHLAK
jgi:Methane oxygenase PmoA